MKARDLLIQLFHFFVVKQCIFCAATEDEVNIFVGNIIVFNVVHHASEWSNAGAGADHENIFV